ncbi:Orn/Lys/Arg family decarboxylase [Paraburkholderia caballeronis]|uniref:Lysine decarboxylase/arginine decarboxylase n=1 Tax=Paraburkholderia caballeronis TaxID=416943 RepID=A0A1H7VQ20_9BURK|nr:Orn/Lys/Arg decarboxylase N-terminal domain-containing protein [Paraburkholderia caballeronis]PXW14949.1 lysine decarboxylase/arginine decarboxylase [Paraburkholderia caballeronis]PXW93582.1 lysine decarboxylase/arginine decarboxylase [Paraburkholderia caballeronis]RAJ88913.1 lysine decarboxylase/arginine decarboxylase [Paraburkholderia caballeronis]SED96662.1 lysine decarboxylase/arginine decarboxylase [Paraburkholderia caballeronis]SEM10897.1 lysine decarboxylase/arginine decarboxylase [P
MIRTITDRFPMRALLVSNELADDTSAGRAARVLAEDLAERRIDVIRSNSADDARAVLGADASIQCVLLDWDLHDDPEHAGALAVLDEARARSATLPVFLLANRHAASSVPADAMEKADDFIWLYDDSPDFIGGRIAAAIGRYREHVLPPMFRALVEFSQVYEYSWHTPGHTGGTAFLKSPVGRAFFSFFGEELFRSDLSISVGELGSLLDHSGPIGEGERYAARVFGAHRTYYVTNGSSTSNRVILMASVTRDQIALCDRNCHKSVEHAMTLSGAIPTYLLPTRNRYGIIGPIPPSRLTPAALKDAIASNPLVRDGIDPTPVHAIITNSTYDGLCYDVARVEALLGQSVDRLHFDEAWYGYARFNPLYERRFAMHGEPKDHDASRPTVFSTQSTHKLLAALSQASMIHVRDGRRPIEHARFNEAFMMHASTSPQYAIIASNDVSAAMMDGPGGRALTSESIHEAIAFRQMMSRLNAEFAARGEWFFNAWQPPVVQEATGPVPFHLADPQRLATDPSCWTLNAGDAWHGFDGLDADYCMLDPIKVSIVTPGVEQSGELAATGIPACIVTSYLDQRGIVVEKTTDFTILFLFSMGVTKGKWGTLANALLDFRRDYDNNAPLEQVLPSLARAYPARYGSLGLKDLAAAMFDTMRALRSTDRLAHAFSMLPSPDLSPVQAYERLVKGNVETVTLDGLANRTVATGVVPYPPGIPLLMPGENAGPADGPVLAYLKALETFDHAFPGFTHDIHGVEVDDGAYRVNVVARPQPEPPASNR